MSHSPPIAADGTLTDRRGALVVGDDVGFGPHNVILAQVPDHDFSVLVAQRQQLSERAKKSGNTSTILRTRAFT